MVIGKKNDYLFIININKMNSNYSLISNIINRHNKTPYYFHNGYNAINDDRVGRIVMFKIYESDNKVYADFRETSQVLSYYYGCALRSANKEIKSVEDFNQKWNSFYNDLH